MPHARRFRSLVLGAAGAALVLTFQPVAGDAAPARAVVSAPGVTLAHHHPAWAITANDRGVLAPSRKLDHLTVMLARSPERQRAFDELRVAQQTPGSSLYHHWLTPAEIGARYGATDAELAALTTWLRDQGFKVLHVSNSRAFVEISGTAAVASAAFGVELHHYAVGTRTLIAIDRPPTIPAHLAPMVRGVTGLVERIAAPQHVATSVAHGRQAGTSKPQVVDGNGLFYVAPVDFTTIYNAAPAYANGLTGAGQTIGIIGRARVLVNDIVQFGGRTGVAMPIQNEIIPPAGVDPGAPCADSSCEASSLDQEEATLDVQRAGSIAFGATIDLITSAATDTEDGTVIALEFAIDSFGSGVDANILTMSFGLCEDLEGQDTTQALDQLYQQAAAQGQSVFVSSGDAAAAGCDAAFSAPPSTQSLGMNALCASGSLTCVGGTLYTDPDSSQFWDSNGNALSYIPEGAWNEPLDGNNQPEAVGTGGGESEFVVKPSYQSGFGPSGSTGRLTPDIAFTASLHDSYFGCFAAASADCVLDGNNQFNFIGFAGTSASTPSMAGVMALVNEQVGSNQGLASPSLYQLAGTSVFNDITVASSGVGNCKVGTPSTCNNSTAGANGLGGGQPGFLVANGYDEATGLGSINVANLIASWPDQAPGLKVQPAQTSVSAGSSVTVALFLSGFTNPNGATFSCSGLPEGATCVFGKSGGKPSMTIETTGPVGAAAPVGGMTSRDLGILVFAMGALGLIVLAARRPRGRRWVMGFALASLAAGASCNTNADNGDGNHGDATVDAGSTPLGTSTITVIGTGGGDSATGTLRLTVTN